MIKVLMGRTGRAPYDESAPGDVLATFNAAVLGQLLLLDKSFELQPGLIQYWKWNFKDLTYELKLKPGIRFHSGREATASDLEFSLLRGFFSTHRSFYKIYLGNIEGIEKAESQVGFKSGVVPGVVITGPLSVKVKLKTPNPSFLYALTNPYFSLVPREEMTNDLVNWKDVPIGAGPYRVFAGFKDGKTLLVRNEANETNIPEKIELSTTEEKGVRYDISLTQMGSDEKALTKTLSKYPVSVWSVFFSFVHPLGKDFRFRKAVQLGIDAQSLIEDFPDFRPATELLPKQIWGRADIRRTHDVEAAKKLISQLPVELTQKLWRVPVFGGKFSPGLEVRVKRLKEQFSTLGLNFDFYPSNEKFISKEIAESSPITLVGRVTDLVDPLVMFASLRSGSPFPYEHPDTDPDYERLYEKASVAEGMDERVATMRALSAYVDEKVYAVPLLEIRTARFYDPASVQTLGDQDQALILFLDRIRIAK